ncbi:MAG TPA: NADPH:quinone oxidoreductase family protein [Thermoleophilaceae bacterium]|nr:NADPH:quinone oxidoreductase family protein [Thermoleophilaceae bacterium]
MRAVRVTELGGPASLELAEIAEPTADDGSLLLDVKAAGVAFPDLLLSRGQYQLKPDPPFTLGTELAGVVQTAPEGSGFAAGDRVMAMTMLGAFADVATSLPALTFRLPDELDFAQGGGYVMNYHTAHFALVRRAELRAGETLLVHGAGGGVGTAAIQVGKGLGARVVGVVSSDEKERVAREAGADEVVRSGRPPQEPGSAGGARIADWRKQAGPADVIFDPVGGSRFDESVRALATEGRLVVIGFTEGSIPSVAVNRLLFRNVSVVGAAWGAFAFERPEYVREVDEDLRRMVAAGHVRPLIGKRYPLERVRDALEDLDGRRAVGKIVLDMEETA